MPDGRVLLVVGSAYSLHTGNEVNGRRKQLRNCVVPLTTRHASVSPSIEVRIADRPEHDAEQGRPGRNDG